jgi:hypothetical protein
VLPSPQRPALWTQSPPVSSPAWAGPAPSRAATSRRLPRWRPRLPLDRFSVGAASDGLPTAPAAAGAAAEIRAAVLVYLVFGGDDGIGDHGTRARRSLLQAVDEQLAAIPEAVFMVRAVGGGSGMAPSQLRPAGGLSRRDLKRSGGDADFADLLAVVRTLVHSDLSDLRRLGWPATRPVVVLSPAQAPLADAAAVQQYQGLAMRARVIWVMFDCPDGLLSPLFTDGSAVIDAGRPGALGRAVSLLRAEAPAGPDAAGPDAAEGNAAVPDAAVAEAAVPEAAVPGAGDGNVVAAVSAEPAQAAGAAAGPGAGFAEPALPQEDRP